MDAATQVVGTTYKLTDKLMSMVQDMYRARDRREHICNRIPKIIVMLDELQSKKVNDRLGKELRHMKDILHSCMIACDDFKQQHNVEQVVFAHSNLYCLEIRERELDQACNDFDIALSCFMTEQLEKIQEQQCEMQIEQERNAIHPAYGVYPVCKGTLKPPAQVSKPEVSVEGVKMIISWECPESDHSSLSSYEVRYDDVNNVAIKLDAKFESVIISEPKIKPGMVYTIQVRAVNDSGWGAWSEHTLGHFKTGPPNKPGRPNVTVTETTATVSCPKPGPEQCNGAPVDKAIVEYRKFEDSGDWKLEEKEVLESDKIFEIKFSDLPGDTTYQFRIKLANQYGQSQPSNPVEIKTREPVPGVPTRGRPSSHFTQSTAKIRWKPPHEYPKYVAKYIVRYKIMKKRNDPNEQWETKEIPATKLSFKARNLKSHTRYEFHIIAVNSDDEDCGGTERVEAETRWHIAVKAPLTPLVFVGATLASPVLWAGGVSSVQKKICKATIPDLDDQMYDQIIAEDEEVRSITHANIALSGVLGPVYGTLLAPITGIALSHEFVHGSSIISDQSDDEDELSPGQQIWKGMVKGTKKLFNDIKSR